jgi:outer membrane protein insertion porin family
MKLPGKYIIPPLLFVIIGFISCSTVKHLPEGEIMYIGTREIIYHKTGENKKDWKINDFAEKSKDVIMNVWVAPNGAFMGMPYMRFLPMRSYAYNWFYTDSIKGFSHWMMENFGEPPVTLSSVNPEMRAKIIENKLFNRGHFGVEVKCRIVYRGNKKAFVKYAIFIPKAYVYRNIEVKLDSVQEALRLPINNYLQDSKIKAGNDFNLDDIDEEKKLLWEYLQNKGYYYISKNNILILADTTVGEKQVDIQYRIEKGLSEKSFSRVFIQNKKVQIDNKQVDLSEKIVLSGKGIKVDRRLLEGIIKLKMDSAYSLRDTKKSLRNISGTGIFKEPVIRYTPSPDDSLKLDADVELKTVDMFSIGTNGNVAQKSNGYLGPGIGLNAIQKNLFGGAENLRLNMDAYFDFPLGYLSKNVSNSYGIATTAILSSPVLKSRLPSFVSDVVKLPTKNTAFGFEYNNRPDYFSMLEWKGSHSVSWYTSPRVSHELKIININYSKLLNTTPEFDSVYSESAYLRSSIKDQLIIGTSYSYTYNNTAGTNQRFRTYFHADFELSGNILNGIYFLAGHKGKDKKILSVEYSQYARLSTDFRFYVNVGSRGQLVYRNLLGIEKAYGNSTVMPYVKQFYIGGSNSLRPLAARTSGPGRYLELDAKAINQVGDLKLENNLEFRFRIAYVLYGAVWGDLGNIWLWKEDPERPLTNIRFNKIIQDSYFTSGAGLRLDLKYVVIRGDYGAVLYAPIFIDNYKWIWQNKLPLHGLVIAVGYPF